VTIAGTQRLRFAMDRGARRHEPRGCGIVVDLYCIAHINAPACARLRAMKESCRQLRREVRGDGARHITLQKIVGTGDNGRCRAFSRHAVIDFQADCQFHFPDTEPQDAGRNAAKVQLALWLGRKA
jgi:hypothetical protein